ncbi:hypothetical protein [Acrocarpospora catenulata]
MSGLGAEIFAVLGFAGYALGSIRAPNWAALPYLLIAAVWSRRP